MIARTPTGMTLFQLWESPAARQANQDNPAHTSALEESGMRAAIRGSRPTTFDDVELRIPAV